MNVGGGQVGENGLPDNRIYNHMNIQPVVHLDAGGQTAKGRWRAFAMSGNFGGGATWAEGIYEMTYVKQNGVWKIKTLDYHSGFGAPYTTGWVPPAPPAVAANFHDETNKLAAARAAAGKPVERVHLKGHSHISETYAVGTQDRSLSQPVLEFVRAHSGGT